MNRTARVCVVVLLCVPFCPRAEAGPVVVVRVTATAGGGQPNGPSKVGPQALSGTGRWLAFESSASNLVSDTNGDVSDVFVYDRVTQTTTLVSATTAGAQTSLPSYGASMSADGRWVAFTSDGRLDAADTNHGPDAYVHDLMMGTTTLVSLTPEGGQFPNAGNEAKSISVDGNAVLFSSAATRENLYVRDRSAGTTTLVNQSSVGGAPRESAYEGSISADGRRVAFWSSDDGLVPGDTNAEPDVFVRDLKAGLTDRASVASDGTQGTGYSWTSSISWDGSRVAFESGSGNLVPGDTNTCVTELGSFNCGDVFVHDIDAGGTTLVSESNGAYSNDWSWAPAIAGDGGSVAFFSSASNLDPRDLGGPPQAYVHSGSTSRYVSENAAGDMADVEPPIDGVVAISGDGHWTAFHHDADNLVPGDLLDSTDVFLHGDGSSTSARPVITGVPFGGELTGTFRFAATSYTAGLECSFEDGAWTSCTSPATYTVDEVGSYSLRVRVTGNDATRVEAVWTVDQSPPVVTIDAPRPGLTVANQQVVEAPVPVYLVTTPVTVVASASDSQSGIDAVRFTVDGTPVAATKAGGTYRTVIGTGGIHTVSVLATNGAGSSRDTAPITLIAIG